MESHQLALAAGTRIDLFRIESVLGKGGFGITYLAVDTHLGKKVAIKELLPDSIATRVDGSTVVPHSSSQAESWEWARERFLEEARTLAGFSHPAIVGVQRLMEANGTVYLVMDYIEGESYEARLRRIGTEPDQQSLMAVMEPILDGVAEIHAKGLLHRDIKPDNILISQRGQPVLIDFGSARSSIGATMTMTSIVTHGYSPIEQYQTKGRMGPWTDIYSLGAVMCRAITGEKPPVAADRIVEDEFAWLSYRTLSGYSEQFLQVVDWALRVRPEERPKSLDICINHWGGNSPRVAKEKSFLKETHNFKNPSVLFSGYVNSLGMKFVSVPGTNVLFSIWLTRVQDFKKFAEGNDDLGRDWKFGGFEQTNTHPVVWMSWTEAKLFCNWLTKKEYDEGRISNEQEYRLPTDLEWSYAVGLERTEATEYSNKDKPKQEYPWGNQWPPPFGAGNYDASMKTDDFSHTSPVGSFLPNQFGIYDLGGNVWEMCEDFFDLKKETHVKRGSSFYWNYQPSVSLKSSYRGFIEPDFRTFDTGFRIVLSLP